MGGGDLVSVGSLGGRGPSGSPTRSGDGNWTVWEWVTMATQPCFRGKGAVASERGPISGAPEGPGGDLERCAKCVANGGGRCFCCLLAGTLPAGNSGREVVVMVEPCLRKEADTESRKLYFVLSCLGTLLSSSAGSSVIFWAMVGVVCAPFSLSLGRIQGSVLNRKGSSSCPPF